MKRPAVAPFAGSADGTVEHAERPGIRATAVGLAAFAVLMAAIYALVLPLPPLEVVDTAGYISWDPTRSPGYPFMLWATRELLGGFGGLVPVQGVLFVGTTVFCACTVQWISGRRWPAVVFAVAVLAFLPFWKWSAQLRPEIPFIAAMQFCLAAATLACVSPRGRRWALAAGLAAGAAVLLRPVGMFLLPALLLPAVCLWRQRRPAVAMLLPGSMLLVVAACVMGNGLLRGYYAPQAFSGFTLFGKTAPLLPTGDLNCGATTEPWASDLVHQLAPLRAAVAEASGRTLYWVSRQGYDIALYDRYMPVASSRMDRVQSDATARCLGLAGMRHDPWGYTRLAAVHVAGMWTWPWIDTEANVAVARQRIAQPHLGTFLGRKGKLSDLTTVPAAVFWAKTAAWMAVLVLVTGGLVLALVDGLRHPLPVMAGAAGLAVHTYNGLVGAVQFADNRYAYAILPMVVCAVVLTLCALAERRQGNALASPRGPRRE